MAGGARLTNELIDVELECIEGLESVAASELEATGASVVEPVVRERLVRACVRDVRPLLDLRTPVAAYVRIERAGTRPTALVGDSGLDDACRLVLEQGEPGAFESFGIDMPGRTSPAARRIRESIAAATGLRFEQERAQLLVRIRRSKDGWEALVRLTPRPLSSRGWRRRSVPGAVNASIAASIVRLLEPSEEDVFLNLMCGSGTIAIERALFGPARVIVAIDIDHEMTSITRGHAVAAGVGERVAVVRSDAVSAPFRVDAFDRLAAVLPYGFRVGSHDENVAGYRAVLKEAAGVAVSGARFALLTQELRLLEETLAAQRDWVVRSSIRIWQGGHRPNLCILERS